MPKNGKLYKIKFVKKKSIFFAIYCTAIIVFLTLFLIFYVPNSKGANNNYTDNVQTNEQTKPGDEDSTENDSDSELSDGQASNTNDEKPNDNNEGSIGSDDSDNENNNTNPDGSNIETNKPNTDNTENKDEADDDSDSSIGDSSTVGENDTEIEDPNANNNDNEQSPPTTTEDNNSTDSDNENNQTTPESPDSSDSNSNDNQDKNESNDDGENQSGGNGNNSSLEQNIFLYDSNGNLFEDDVIYTNNKSFSFSFKIKSTDGESIIQEVECELYSDNASLVLNTPPFLILYFHDYGSITLKITSLYDDNISRVITIIYQ